MHSRPRPQRSFIDTLVMELREPEVGQPFCSPAIAAAARELWQTLPSPPSIAEFLPCVKKHQQRIEAVFKQLGDILDAADWAEDTINEAGVSDELRFEEDFGFSEWGKA